MLHRILAIPTLIWFVVALVGLALTIVARWRNTRHQRGMVGLNLFDQEQTMPVMQKKGTMLLLWTGAILPTIAVLMLLWKLASVLHLLH